MDQPEVVQLLDALLRKWRLEDRHREIDDHGYYLTIEKRADELEAILDYIRVK